MKWPPLRVNVNPPLPGVTPAGEMLERGGRGLLTASESAADAPPPGVGFTTETERLPAEAMALAGTAVAGWALLREILGERGAGTGATKPWITFRPLMR